MNVILNPSQSDTKLGEISALGAADLTGKENLLLKLTNSSGTPKFAVPSAVTDIALYICASGDVAANYTAGEAPHTGGNARVKANGTIVTGDILVHDSSAYGKVIALPASAGTYFSCGIAEESAAAGGLVKFRPFPRLVSVAGIITDSTGGTPATTFAAITAGASYAQADMVAVKNALAQIAIHLNAKV